MGLQGERGTRMDYRVRSAGQGWQEGKVPEKNVKGRPYPKTRNYERRGKKGVYSDRTTESHT